MAKIKKIFAREILDSRGNPTIETKVILDDETTGVASVPAGASRGTYEAIEIRDHDPSRFNGLGVLQACQNIEKIISPALAGFEISKQKEINQKLIELDGTKNKSHLGANSTLAVSLACSRAGAVSSHLPLYQYLREVFNLNNLNGFQLPVPLFNLINGGRHAEGRSNLEIQEFFVIPQKIRKISQMIRVVTEIFSLVRRLVKEKIGTYGIGDEGGITAFFKENKEAIQLLVEAIKKAGYKLKSEVNLGLDCASSEFYDKKKKIYKFEKKERKVNEMIEIYKDWVASYPLILLEDPLEEENFSSWSELKKNLLSLNKNFIIVGDDLFTTNIERLKMGIDSDSANGLIIKPNQIGTILETMECIKMARQVGYKIIIAHRSGETNDTFIADLSVAVNADFIKAGAPMRGERVVKYNRLMEIEEELENV